MFNDKKLNNNIDEHGNNKITKLRMTDTITLYSTMSTRRHQFNHDFQQKHLVVMFKC